jgi:hypothetical protein
MALFFQGRDRVFDCAIPEKLGLFSAFRWLYSFRGETEFLIAPRLKNSVSSLFIDASVLSGERPSFFARYTRKTRSLFCVNKYKDPSRQVYLNKPGGWFLIPGEEVKR